MNTMYAVRNVISLAPAKQHVATCIQYSDLLEMRDEFVTELLNTVSAFVYSSAKQSKLIAQFEAEGRDRSASWAALGRLANSKFRRQSLAGQFSELLLCNLLQHYFKAVPLLRKMPLTTNPALERNGADAIHVAQEDGKYLIYIGEAKTFDRKSNCFRDAVVEAIDDVVLHYNEHRKELQLYTYEDFLTPELQALAEQYQAGTATGLEVHLVCIATYNCKKTVAGADRNAILSSIMANVAADANAIKSHPVFNRVPVALLPRLNYILFSVRDMQSLIDAFTKGITGAK